MKDTKSTKLGSKLWLQILLFGIIGQIAWMVENMYFATFAQNLFDNPSFGNMYYVATTLMVVFSALTATITTIFIGGLVDRLGKRKVFISFGYILWGVTIMIFALIPTIFGSDKAGGVMAMLVIFDCIMTFFGSTAYDAAFNTWITDITDVTNRGKVDSVLSMLPVLGLVIAVLVAMFTFDKGKEDPFMYQLFFIILGILPIVVGIISIFTLKDSPNIVKNSNSSYLKDTFYGFNIKVIKENKFMYIALTCLCLLGVSQQVYMSYLLNFIQRTLGITDYLLPAAGLIVVAGIITATVGVLYDKKGRKHFYMPLLVANILSTFIIYLMKFMTKEAYIGVFVVFGGIMLGTSLSLFAALMASFQDYIPEGYEGRFQGIRMVFAVLIPMIIGPIISLAIGINSFDSQDTVMLTPPFEIYLASAIVALVVILPMIFVRKDADNLRNRLLNKDKMVSAEIPVRQDGNID